MKYNLSILMIRHPYLSKALEKKYRGQYTVSLNGKILGIGKDCLIALKEARKVMPNIDEKEYLISRIYGDMLLA